MLSGDLGATARARAHRRRRRGLEAVGLERAAAGAADAGRDRRPTWPTALAETGPASVEWKLDGARIQVHRDGDEVARLHPQPQRHHRPPARGRRGGAGASRRRRSCSTARSIGLDDDGRPRPLPGHDEPLRPASSVADAAASRLQPFFFDVLHVDGDDLLDEPLPRAAGRARRGRRPRARIPAVRHRRRRRGATRSSTDALAAGHEGVMVKALDSPYEAGPAGRGVAQGQAGAHARPRRARRRVGPRPAHAAGCRTCTSAPAARDGAFVMVGKTFKGLTDELLRWQTERFLRARRSARRGPRRPRPPRAGRRDRARRRAGVDALPRRGRAALRPVRRYREDKQAARGRHHRSRAGAAVNRSADPD